MNENNELFTDVYSLEEAALNGLISLETFLNEYKRLTQTGGERMIDIVVAFLAGIFFGSAFGTFIVALLTVTKDGDDHDGL